jgi:hypothetical protein
MVIKVVGRFFNFLRTMVIYQNCFFVLKNLWYEP